MGIAFDKLTHEQKKKALSLIEVEAGKLKDDPRRIDLTDQQFGEWTVLIYAGKKKWVCICSCGEIRSIRGIDLRNNTTKSCGHENRAADLVGKTFGYWEVIEKVDGRHHKCRCNCGCGGTEKVVLTYDLIYGKTKSCGINTTRKESIIGKKFNHWTVLEKAADGRYKCECDCDEHTIGYVTRADLVSGRSKSCGHDTNKLVDITGKIFGNWKVIKHAGYGKWLCKCLCEKGTEKIIRHTELINGDTTSCGCMRKDVLRNTMLNKYGDTASSKIDNPRTEKQLGYVENAESLKNAILNNFEYKPTIYELEELLGLNYSSIIKLVHKYDLEKYTTIYENVSSLERDVLAYVYELIPKELVETGNRKILNGKELDIYIPSKNLAIEFNGTYWHSHLFKDRKYHQNKTIACARAGVRLIQIFEYEWINDVQREKIKDLLKRVIKPEANIVIHARKTKLVKLNYSDVKEFLNNNHLQNTVTSKINYGLHYNNEIVAVMTFGSPRFSRDGSVEYELLRLAFKSGTVVIGGTEKMFKQFINDYKPSSIVSYCDISKFNGGVYSRLGFKTTIDSITDPNYVWADKRNNMLPRYRTMKHKLLEQGLGTPDMTENQIMESLGYFKVYDCGNLKFIWNSLSD